MLVVEAIGREKSEELSQHLRFGLRMSWLIPALVIAKLQRRRFRVFQHGDEESASALDKITGELYDGSRETAYLVAEAYAWIGDEDEAFEWLEKAYALDERYGIQGYWFHRIMFLPIWANLHDDPRWDELRKRMNMTSARLGGLEFSIPEWMSLHSRSF